MIYQKSNDTYITSLFGLSVVGYVFLLIIDIKISRLGFCQSDIGRGLRLKAQHVASSTVNLEDPG